MWSIPEGYAEVWRSRRTLVPVVAMVIGPVLTVLFVLRLLIAGSDAPIVNGAHLLPVDGAQAVAEAVIVLGAWVLALTGGVIAVAARLRSIELPIAAILRHALPPASTTAIGLLILIGLLLGAVTLAGAFDPAFGVITFMAGLVIFPPFLFRVPIAALRQPGTIADVTRGRWLRTVGAVFLGVIALPGLALTAMSPLLRAVPADVLFGPILILLTAGQAGVLTTIYIRAARPDLALDAQTGSRPGRQAAAAMAAVMLLPALVAVGAAQVNPFGAPRITERHLELGARVSAVGWPSGQPPIIATGTGFFDCRDVNCAKWVRRDFAPVRGQIIPPNSVQEVTADGAVLSADGSDYESVVVQRCRRDGNCVRGEIPTATGYPVLAVTGTRDGAIHIATATGIQGTPVKTAIAVIRCTDATCADPVTVDLGVYEGSAAHNGTRMRVAVDAAGTPSVAIVGAHFGARIITCDSPACEHPADSTVPVDTARMAAVLFPGLAVGPGMLEAVSNELQRCSGCEFGVLADWVQREPRRGAFTFSRAGLFAVSSDPPPPDATYSVYIGYNRHPFGDGRYVLWRCARPDCGDKRSLLLNFGPASDGVWLAARDDGSVLVVQDHGTVTTVVVPA